MAQVIIHLVYSCEYVWGKPFGYFERKLLLQIHRSSNLLLILERHFTVYTNEVKVKIEELRWCRARDLSGSQIPATTGGFELRVSCIRSSYLTRQAIRPNKLDGFGVSKFATLRQE